MNFRPMDTAHASSECAGAPEKGLMWSTMHSIETARITILAYNQQARKDHGNP
jgi:hypothetical protein